MLADNGAGPSAAAAGFAAVQACGTDNFPTNVARPKPPSTGARTAAAVGTRITAPKALPAWISDRSSPVPNCPYPNTVRATAERFCPGVVTTVLKSPTEPSSDAEPEPDAGVPEEPPEGVSAGTPEASVARV